MVAVLGWVLLVCCILLIKCQMMHMPGQSRAAPINRGSRYDVQWRTLVFFCPGAGGWSHSASGEVVGTLFSALMQCWLCTPNEQPDEAQFMNNDVMRLSTGHVVNMISSRC